MKHFLLMGRTGVGKSSFINTCFGINMAETSHYESCTKIVKHYTRSSQWGDLCVIDSPGLCEEDDAIDDIYLDMIKQDDSIPKKISLVFVTPVNETRFRPEEKKAIKKIYKQFPLYFEDIWLMLTFAASLDKVKREEATQHRIHDIMGYIKEINQSFIDFTKIGVIDNVVSGWSNSSITTDEFLLKGKS